MSKYEFLAEVQKRLSGMDRDDIKRSLDFYSEMIDDRVEEGLTEEEAVKALGPIDDIVAAIRGGEAAPEGEKAASESEKAAPVSSSDEKGDGFPSILSALLVTIRVLFVIGAVCLWTLAVSIMIAGVSTVAVAAGAMFVGIAKLFTDGVGASLFWVGGGVAAIGIGMAIITGARASFRGINALTRGVNRALDKKGEKL